MDSVERGLKALTGSLLDSINYEYLESLQNSPNEHRAVIYFRFGSQWVQKSTTYANARAWRKYVNRKYPGTESYLEVF